MNGEQIEQILKLVTNNQTAEKREAALREAARLLELHLKAEKAKDRLASMADGIAASHPRTSWVRTRHWAPGDDYLVVEEFQVFEQDGFKPGDEVELTVRKTGRMRKAAP